MDIRIEDILENKLFEDYYQLLIEENNKYNLTSIVLKDEVYFKHFIDSIHLSDVYDLNSEVSLCDVGSGAGFPSIPLKIMFPSIKLTIIEPTLKKCNFLKMVLSELNLKDVQIINDRSENVKGKNFDVVCARAVSNLPVLLELCIPLVKVNGYFIAMKGANYQEELNISNNALKKLNARVEEIKEYVLKNGNEEYGHHSLIKIIKNKECLDIYPRPYAQIKKKPL